MASLVFTFLPSMNATMKASLNFADISLRFLAMAS